MPSTKGVLVTGRPQDDPHDAEDAFEAPGPRPVVNALLVAVAFGLLGLAVWQHQEQIRGVFRRRLDSRLFAAAFLVYMTGVLLSFCVVRAGPGDRASVQDRPGVPARVHRQRLQPGDPGAVGGDFIKAAYLVRMDINRTQAVASMVIDRIVGLLGLFLLAGVAGAVAWPLASRR